MARRAAFLLVLLPGVALAQSAVTSNPAYANRTACASTTATTTWTWTSGVVPGTSDVYRLAAYRGTNACATTVPGSADAAVVANDLTAPTQTDSASVFLADVRDAATVNCGDANDQPVTLCVYLVPATGTASLVSVGRLDFWLAVPPRPTISSVVPANGSLKVTVSHGTANSDYTAVGSDVNFTVTCAPPAGSGLPTSTATGNASQVMTCGGLTNGTTYTVTAYGTSAAGQGNPGPVSDPYSGPATDTTPQPFEGFWELYQGAGGVEQGGCGGGGAGAIAPAAALLALLALRRRRA